MLASLVKQRDTSGIDGDARMRPSNQMIRRGLLLAGLSLSLSAMPGAVQALSAHGSDTQGDKTDEDSKVDRNIVVVESGGEPVTVVRKGKSRVIASSHGLAEYDRQRKEAVEKAQSALAEVNKRLAKARNKSEKQALKAAAAGLKAAIKSLESQQVRQTLIGPSSVEIARIESDAMADALEELEGKEHEIRSMRIELKDQLAEAREEIAEALGDLDLEIDMDGDVRVLRLETLRSAERSIEAMEEEQLEALRRAEKEIKRERARLEERMKRRQQETEDKEQ